MSNYLPALRSGFEELYSKGLGEAMERLSGGAMVLADEESRSTVWRIKDSILLEGRGA